MQVTLLIRCSLFRHSQLMSVSAWSSITWYSDTQQLSVAITMWLFFSSKWESIDIFAFFPPDCQLSSLWIHVSMRSQEVIHWLLNLWDFLPHSIHFLIASVTVTRHSYAEIVTTFLWLKQLSVELSFIPVSKVSLRSTAFLKVRKNVSRFRLRSSLACLCYDYPECIIITWILLWRIQLETLTGSKILCFLLHGLLVCLVLSCLQVWHFKRHLFQKHLAQLEAVGEKSRSRDGKIVL